MNSLSSAKSVSVMILILAVGWLREGSFPQGKKRPSVYSFSPPTSRRGLSRMMQALPHHPRHGPTETTHHFLSRDIKTIRRDVPAHRRRGSRRGPGNESEGVPGLPLDAREARPVRTFGKGHVTAQCKPTGLSSGPWAGPRHTTTIPDRTGGWNTEDKKAISGGISAVC